MIRVTANQYLDAPRPEWVDAELLGQVRYDWDRIKLEGSRLVEIDERWPAIQVAATRASMG